MPQVFHVNWFRKDADDNWLWPGFGENMRVLKWIVERTRDAGVAVETAIGWLPTPEAIGFDELGIGQEVAEELLAVDTGQWQDEVGAEEPGETPDQVAVGGPSGKQWLPVDCLLQSPDRLTTGVGTVGRSSGVAQVGFVFDRSSRFCEFPVNHLLQPRTGVLGSQAVDNDKSVAAEGLLFFERQLSSVGAHAFLAEALSEEPQRPRHGVSAVSTMRN